MNGRKPVTLNMKIGDILKEHPELLDVLVAQSPHFRRLKNPILRRIHGHLVSVAQAAAIAGLDPVTLVRNLNAAIGQSSVEEDPVRLSSMAGTPAPEWLKTAPVSVQLDVREYQRRNEDPFAAIMAAVVKVEEGKVFRLRNTFEPLPLYDVLGRKGFAPWARQIGPEDWEIFFLNVGRAPIVEDDMALPDEDADLDSLEPKATLAIDVRELTPPQPMMRILDALSQIGPGETLLVRHVRRPVYLYPKLAELGCTQKTVEKGPGHVELYIRKGR